MLKQKLRRSARITRYIVYKETLIDRKEHLWSFIGAFTGILAIALLQEQLLLDRLENVFLIGSFGASSVLIYGAIQSPLAQPRNLVGGHVLSAITGVTVYKLFPHTLALAAPLAVSLSIVLMQMTKTLHPPGGATALIAVIGTPRVKELGYWYVVSPVLTGCIILLIVALVCNNMTPHRSYPTNSRFTRLIRARNKKEEAA